jgi:hypothetical protein
MKINPKGTNVIESQGQKNILPPYKRRQDKNAEGNFLKRFQNNIPPIHFYTTSIVDLK